ncbi:MAG TPA: pit accessory protein [Verrucomicrobiae bacterium]|nr:pit accessory protein [Verrucomicrobiae bacterium]
MFSVQSLLGRDDEFCALLEASAQEAVHSVESLRHVLDDSSSPPSLKGFIQARRKDKLITNQIAELLVSALVTSFDRQDIEAIAQAIYKVPKTVEKFAEHYLISYDHVREFDFTRQFVLMEEAVKSVLETVRAFREGAGMAEMKRLDARIQRLENDADDVVVALLRKVYAMKGMDVRPIILKDLIELNEKVVDRCRDASGMMVQVVVKRGGGI